MTPLTAMLAQHAKPTFCSCEEVKASIADILDVGSRVQQQIIEYRRLLTGAMLTEGTDDTRGTTEHIQQTLRRSEKDAAAFIEVGQRLARAYDQLDRYLREHAEKAAPTAGSPSSAAATVVAAPPVTGKPK